MFFCDSRTIAYALPVYKQLKLALTEFTFINQLFLVFFFINKRTTYIKITMLFFENVALF